jgi:hypothetical protein
MRKHLFLFLLLLHATAWADDGALRQRIDLAGVWQFALDPQAGLAPTDILDDTIVLPGTTDTNLKGTPPSNTSETTHLTRLHAYVGRAWYRREVTIPKTWKRKQVVMVLERTKPAVVYVDGMKAGENDDICTAQKYDLSRWLTPGRHTITVMVDNGETVPPQLLSNSHAYTEDTQTNWNGVIGEMFLEAHDPLHISDMVVEPDRSRQMVSVRLTVAGKLKKHHQIIIEAVPLNFNGQVKSVAYQGGKTLQCDDKGNVVLTIPFGRDAMTWDEFHPRLYTLHVSIVGHDEVKTTFGFVDFQVNDHHFQANGKEIFLRGKHDACVFPLQAHVPMDVEAWMRYLGKCREYGINHVRFHSWCPPEAAFAAADELGIYLQPELPFWGDFKKEDQRLMSFLHKEGEHILQTYGHHPSFVMFALGNELWGSIEEMAAFVSDFRKIAPTKLFTFGSNYYLGYQGVKPGMDYFTTCRVGGEAWGSFDTHTRGSFSFADTYDGGMINHLHPNTKMNFENACARSSVPVISHETAQFQVYPDYDEIKKYTGVLYPYNMQVFYKRMIQAGLADQAKSFHHASGQWSLQLYKADVEMDLRTKNMAGFQLLDLQDYPGQGSAYVGMLDAFMDEKTFMRQYDGKKVWSQFCSRIVPMAEMEKMCFSNSEKLRAHVVLSNYGSGEDDEECLDGVIAWRLVNGQNTICQGSLPIPEGQRGLLTIGDITADLSDIPTAIQGKLVLDAVVNKHAQRHFTNSYPVWIYPAGQDLEKEKQGIIITKEMTADMARSLEQGASVLFMPDTLIWKENRVGGLFQTDYWNYRMFKTISENNHRPVSPGTLGILCRPEHPLLRHFPTDMHTSWQWFPVVKASAPMILDNLPSDYRPIIQVIDNIERSHRLGLVFEFSVGKGRLLLCMSDLEKASESIEGRQFYLSLLRYMHSADFAPQTSFSLSNLMDILRQPVKERSLEELNNISPY